MAAVAKSPPPGKSVALGRRIPWGVLALALLIPLIGVINLASASQATRPNLWLLQLAYLGVGWVLAVGVIRVRTYMLEELAYPIYFGVNVLLLLVLVAGVTIKGSQRWLDLGPVNLQPSELAKLSIILVTARYFSRYRVMGGYTLRMLFMPLNVTRPLAMMAALAIGWTKFSEKIGLQEHGWVRVLGFVVAFLWLAAAVFVLVRKGLHHTRLVAPIDIPVLPFLLILIEPDLGTSLIVLAIAGVQVLFCGVRRASLLIAAVLGVSTVIFAWNFVMHDYQKRRVETFLNPEADARGAGYHATQSKIAIGSGQFTGKGHGEGTQTQLSFLPENHTDFVFSVLAEEQGFVGSSLLLALFAALISMMVLDARTVGNRFAVLVNIGAAAMLFWHVVINIGMVTGLMPVVGVTLPLMSYGGSSLLTQIIAIAFAINTRMWRRA